MTDYKYGGECACEGCYESHKLDLELEEMLKRKKVKQ